jgi:hypothetical protein
MACTGRRTPQQTAAQRQAEVDAALAELVKQLVAGTATAVIGPDGSIAFDGWTERSDLTDACAYRVLLERDDWEMKQAIARAETMAGRALNVNAINGGTHSHDGGRTWHGGH